MFGIFNKSRRSRREPSEHWTLTPETKRGIFIVILFTISFITLLSFFQATGSIGVFITTWLGKAFGWSDWLIPVLLLLLTYFLLRPNTYNVRKVNYLGLAILILSACGLLDLIVHNGSFDTIVEQRIGGGALGYLIGHNLYRLAAMTGSLIILIALLLIGGFIFFNTSFSSISSILKSIAEWWRSYKERRANSRAARIDTEYANHFKEEEEEHEEEENDEESNDEEAPVAAKLFKRRAVAAAPQPKRVLPKIDLPLDLLTSSNQVPASGDINAIMKKIEATLASFGIEVTMGEVNVGPTVTQYTLKPSEGVKLNQITALNNDLSLALAAHPIRIEAPIPGKSLVGIEVPNQAVSIVKVKEVLSSSVYQNRKSSLMLALGKDVTGKVMMADLEKMPHLLIAGATGSGKSVCINSMIISLLYQNSPDILKLILVDPKRVELSLYDHIPHLITPVITEVDKTINALRWAVHQMDERYKLLQAAGKKNIQSYNEARLLEKMPYIIVIVDELADLMMVAPKEVEAAIIRLAQMARAVGIHLIIATQRPSVNVITGLIKANITSRIAFSVASVVDSRTIIDSSGAEKLLGNGDMLYISAELSKPKRIQGAFVGEKEIGAVADYLRAHGEPEYDPAVIERRQNKATSAGVFDGDSEEGDIRDAALVVIKAKRASATLLQSRMRVGFAKASRLLDLMEERGIIGPQNSSKARDVLMTIDEFEEQFGSDGELREERVDEDLLDYDAVRDEPDTPDALEEPVEDEETDKEDNS